MTAEILEIFSSIQGEGLFTGVKQIFVRFYNCNMNCRYCDVEKKSPSREFTVDKLLSIIKQLNFERGPHHSVSMTGGEPLLYKDFLKELLPGLKGEKFKIYLETNGTLADELLEIIDYLDIIAMDFKLPSSTGEAAQWERHKRFLHIARQKDCFVKAVVTNNTTREDIAKAADLIHSIDKELLLVLQPAWPVQKEERVRTKQLFDYLFLAEEKLSNVRVMPQAHKLLGVK